MFESGNKLSMSGDAIWKGTFNQNGTMLKIHENAFTMGYSEIVDENGNPTQVPFGSVVYRDVGTFDNRFLVKCPNEYYYPAGVVVREPSIANGYPAENSELAPYQKGLLLVDGYMVFKKGRAWYNSETADTPVTDLEEVNLYDFFKDAYGRDAQIQQTSLPVMMYACPKEGGTYFSAMGPDDKNGLVSYPIGYLVSVNPDDKSITMKIDFSMLLVFMSR